jgi:hypothetical protein
MPNIPAIQRWMREKRDELAVMMILTIFVPVFEKMGL